MNSKADQSMEDVAAQANLEAMYEKSLDDIPELPGFPLPFPGVYKLKIVAQGLKDIGESRAQEIQYEVVESLEVNSSGPAGEQVIPGDKFSQLYFMTTAKSIAFNFSRITTLLKPVSDAFHCGNTKETLEKAVGCEVTAIVKLRQNKMNKEQWFPEVEELQLT
jgi:hypothetical protein